MNYKKEGLPYVICVGYSKLPDGMAAKNAYGNMGVGIKIDKKSNKVISTSATFITDMCSSFLNEIFVAYDLDNGIEEPIHDFENSYYGLGKKAIIAAIRDVYNQYLIYKTTK